MKFTVTSIGCTIILILTFLVPNESLAQGSNWKLTGNNNVGANSFLGSTNNESLRFRANDTEWFSISTSGSYRFNSLNGMTSGLLILDNLGIASKLDFSGFSSDVLNGTGTFSPISGITGWTLTAPTLTTPYDVGIGTVAPTEKLSVDGNIFSTGTLYGTEVQIVEFVQSGYGFRINETLCIEGTSSDGINSICAENADLHINSKPTFAYNTLINYNNSGNVGIGTNAPLAKIHTLGNSIFEGDMDVSGEVIMGGIGGTTAATDLQMLVQTPTGQLKTADFSSMAEEFGFTPADPLTCIANSSGDIENPVWFNGLNKIYVDCPPVNVGVGTNDPLYKIHAVGTVFSTKTKVGNLGATEDALINGFVQNSTQDILVLGRKVGASAEQEKLTLNNSGTLTLNSEGPKAIIVNDLAGEKILQLEQDGLLKTRKVRVDLDVWSDYVFRDDYPLKSLTETKSYVSENNHLPGVPSEDELKKDGLDLGNMQQIQMEKIEEIYLHMFEMSERMELMQKRLDELESENNELKSKKEDR